MTKMPAPTVVLTIAAVNCRTPSTRTREASVERGVGLTSVRGALGLRGSASVAELFAAVTLHRRQPGGGGVQASRHRLAAVGERGDLARHLLEEEHAFGGHLAGHADAFEQTLY